LILEYLPNASGWSDAAVVFKASINRPSFAVKSVDAKDPDWVARQNADWNCLLHCQGHDIFVPPEILPGLLTTFSKLMSGGSGKSSSASKGTAATTGSIISRFFKAIPTMSCRIFMGPMNIHTLAPADTSSFITKPLAVLHMLPTEFCVRSTLHETNVELAMKWSAFFHNLELHVWEPFVEPTTLRLLLCRNSRNGTVTVNSKLGHVNVNFSYHFVKALVNVLVVMEHKKARAELSRMGLLDGESIDETEMSAIYSAAESEFDRRAKRLQPIAPKVTNNSRRIDPHFQLGKSFDESSNGSNLLDIDSNSGSISYGETLFKTPSSRPHGSSLEDVSGRGDMHRKASVLRFDLIQSESGEVSYSAQPKVSEKIKILSQHTGGFLVSSDEVSPFLCFSAYFVVAVRCFVQVVSMPAVDSSITRRISDVWISDAFENFTTMHLQFLALSTNESVLVHLSPGESKLMEQRSITDDFVHIVCR
jgi:hypothetical protein